MTPDQCYRMTFSGAPSVGPTSLSAVEIGIDIARKLTSDDVLERLAWLMATRGMPRHIRSDKGPEMAAKVVREGLAKVGVTTLCIESGSPWENGYGESFNGKLRDELLNGEVFHTVNEARVLIERWRQRYNTVRPHSSLGYRPVVNHYGDDAMQVYGVQAPTLETAPQQHPFAAPPLTETQRARESRPRQPAQPGVLIATHTPIPNPRAPHPSPDAPKGPDPLPTQQTNRPASFGHGP